MEAFVAEQVELDRPQDAREAWLARRAAVSAWQVERGEELETLQAAILGAGAVDAELERRASEVEELVALLPESPARAVRNLLRTVEGCEWLLAALWDLADGIESGRPDLDAARVDALCRRPLPGLTRVSRAGALALALASGDTDALWPAGPPELGPAPPPGAPGEALAQWQDARRRLIAESRQEWQAELTTLLLSRISEVESTLAPLRDRPDHALEYAALAASFDQSAEGERLRRYNRANVRRRERSMQELASWREGREDRESLPIVQKLVTAAAPPPTPVVALAAPEAEASRREAGRAGLPRGLAADWLRFAGRQDIPTAGAIGALPESSDPIPGRSSAPDFARNGTA